MQKLRKSKKYALFFIEEDRVEMEMAKSLYEQGVNIKTISKASGMTEEQVEAAINKQVNSSY